VDPCLFTVFARVKKPAEMDAVRDDILAAVNSFREKPVDAARLEAVKRHLRYAFALSMNNSEAVAGSVARFVALRRTPETINRLYEVYDSITPQDIQAVAQKYFSDSSRTIVTLTGGKAQ
jgi:zinc protease